MPKTSLTATTTVETRTTVKLSPVARKMLRERGEEHVTLTADVKEKKKRLKRIEAEVSDLFKKEKQGKALLAGTDLDDHRFKMVCGDSSTFDRLGFLKEHGLTQEDWDAFVDTKPKAPYVKISAKGAKDDDES